MDRAAGDPRAARVTRYRHKLVGLRTSCKEQVHAVLAKLRITVTASDIFGTGGQLWLDGLALPQPYKGKVASLRMLAAELSTALLTSRGSSASTGRPLVKMAPSSGLRLTNGTRVSAPATIGVSTPAGCTVLTPM